MKRILYILAIALSIVACSDEIDKSNRYTFTGETVADYMLNRSEKYSHMITLLKRADLFSLLQTYGQYTLFLPDNASVEKYVQEQDSIYWATKNSDNPIWTGVTSPLVEDLSDSMAVVLARTHIVEGCFNTSNLGEGSVAQWNFDNHYLGINYVVEGENYYIMINNYSRIMTRDEYVENGIIHTLDKAINPASFSLPEHIGRYNYFGLFSAALQLTGLADSLLKYSDDSYVAPEKYSLSAEGAIYVPDNLVSVPEKKFYRYTAFVEPDEVFHKNSIYTLDDLKAFAEKWYGTEERDNPRNPKNALHKFVAYHFVEGEIPYNMIVPSESGLIENGYVSTIVPGYDLYNYYPTMMGKLMKVLKPLSTPNGRNIYINYSKREIPYNFEMRNHTNVRIIELTEFIQTDEQYANFVSTAGNGLIHPIDKILIYNEDEMAGNILNERMRFDIAALQPELSSNNLWQGSAYVYFPIDYCKGLKKCGLEDLMHYRVDFGHNCDFFIFMNEYDVAIKIPPVPTRTYEIRYSTIQQATEQVSETDFYQVYFDDKICGLPVCNDIISTDSRIGWVRDDETLDNGVENDKLLRNKGWMKAPDTYNTHNYRPGYVDGSARDDYSSMRKIALIEHLVEGEHWLRFRHLREGNNHSKIASDIFDYIELVPLHIVSDPLNPEDRH